MTAILSIKTSNLHQGIKPELEKEEVKRNILFLLLVLIGVNGSELLENNLQSSSSKIEVLKANLEQKQKQIDQLNDRLRKISNQYDQLNEKGKRLEDLTDSERQDYFLKSRQLQDTFEAAQVRVKIEMKEAATLMQQVIKSTKLDVEPLKKVTEALLNMGTKLSDLFNRQWGNDIRLK